MFTLFDVVIIVLLCGFIYTGFSLGLIQAFGGLIGLIIGAWLAGHYFLIFSEWLLSLMPWRIHIPENIARVIAFILLFIIINRLIALIFYTLDKVFHLIAIIPFLKSINKLMGAIFGFLEGCLFLGLSLYIVSKYSFSAMLDSALLASRLVPKLIYMARILLPLIPQMIRAINGIL